MSNVFGPKKPLFGPYTYRVKRNVNGDTLIAVYHGSKRIAHIDAFWAYSMRSIEEHEAEEAQRVGGRGRRLVCASDLRSLGAEGRYPNVLRVGHAFMDDEAYKGKGIGRAMYEAMMVEGFAVRETRIGGQPGPMFLIPDECGGAGNTSADAKRVWASLARDYPSQGTSIRVDAPPVIGSRAKPNPRRRNPVALSPGPFGGTDLRTTSPDGHANVFVGTGKQLAQLLKAAYPKYPDAIKRAGRHKGKVAWLDYMQASETGKGAGSRVLVETLAAIDAQGTEAVYLHAASGEEQDARVRFFSRHGFVSLPDDAARPRRLMVRLAPKANPRRRNPTNPLSAVVSEAEAASRWFEPLAARWREEDRAGGNEDYIGLDDMGLAGTARQAVLKQRFGPRLLGSGVFRAVVAASDTRFVIKLAMRPSDNLDEAAFWQHAGPRTREMLVPVVAVDPKGRWLIMERTTPLPLQQEDTPRGQALRVRAKAVGLLDTHASNLSSDFRILDYAEPVSSQKTPNPRRPRRPRVSAAERTRILREITESVKDEMQRTGWWTDDEQGRPVERFDRPSEWDINNGMCEEWAETAERRLGGEAADLAYLRYEKFGLPADIFEDVSHIVLLLDGRFYDAQDPQGVSDPRKLHLIRRVSREEFIKGRANPRRRNPEDDYRMRHRPPEDGPLAHELGKGDYMPADVLVHPEWYTGFAQYLPGFWRTLRAAQGRRGATLRIYRALPGAHATFREGDWVTLSLAYAKEHLESNVSEGGHIIAADVPASTLRFAGDDLMEWGYWGPTVAGTPVRRRNPRQTVADRIKRFERHEVRMEASKNLPLFGKGFLALAAQRYTEDEYARLVAAALGLDGRWGVLEEPSAYAAPKGALLKALKERYAVEREKPITVEVRFRDMWEATAYIGEGRYDRTEVGFVVAAPDYPLACPEEYATLRSAHGDAPTYEVVSSRVHPLMQRKGLGVRLYRALGETLGREQGAYLFANACGSRGDTSVEAQRVYRSLGRYFPTEGLVVYFPPTKANPRRNPRSGYTSADRTDPDLWEAVKREVTAGSKGGKPGQWSARKAQLAVALYRQRGGGYWGPKDPRNSLAKWTREKWRTKSGRPSLETGERYLPTKALAALTDAEYAATTRAKRAGMRKGQQFVPQPEAVALKVRAYRRNPDYRHALMETLLENGAKVYTYATLPAPAKAAATEFLDAPEKRAYLVGELPTEYVKQRIVSEWSEPFPWPSFDAYHRWYIGNNEERGTMPRYSAKNRWPSLLVGVEGEGFIYDGWHRFHAYVRAGDPTVPVYLLINKGEADGFRRANPARRAGERQPQPEAVALKVRAYRRNPVQGIHDENVHLKGTYGTAEDVFFGLVQQQFAANTDIFLEQPEGTPERTLRTVARRRLRTLGINPKARAYAIDFLNLTVRGKGSGSRIVGEIEKTLRDEGEQVVFLIAARLFADAPHSRGFWKRMGYTEISGNYEPLVWEFGNEVEDDRIMFKVL